jgi:hypothetical protein
MKMSIFCLSILLAIAATSTSAETKIRVGHFPNITHAQGLIGHALSRQGKGWFEQRLGAGAKIEWFVYNAGPSAMEAIFANSIEMGSGPLHRWLYVILPASLPYLISGMKQGWAFAWRSLMAAEIYVTILTGFGLGHLLHYGRELNAMDQVIGIMLVIVVIGLLADKILFSPWERFLHRRWGTGRV